MQTNPSPYQTILLLLALPERLLRRRELLERRLDVRQFGETTSVSLDVRVVVVAQLSVRDDSHPAVERKIGDTEHNK